MPRPAAPPGADDPSGAISDIVITLHELAGINDDDAVARRLRNAADELSAVVECMKKHTPKGG